MSSSWVADGYRLAAPADSGLRCPTCDYNLTGITENRCPECGDAFDPDQLRAILAGAPGPIPIWDDKDRPLLVRFVRICLLAWFSPRRLGKQFPRCHRRRSAMAFRWMVMTLTMPIVVVAVAFDGVCQAGRVLPPNADQCFWVIAIVVGTWIGVAVFEALFGVVLVGCLTPENAGLRCPDRRCSYSWSGLVGCFRPFIVLSVIVMALSIVLLTKPYSLLIPVTGVFLWWWVALGTAVAVQPARLKVRIVAILLIPIVAAIATFLGVIAGAMICPGRLE